MADKVTIALDAMGGDNAPLEIVKGAAEYSRIDKDAKIILTGRSIEIERILKNLNGDFSNISIHNAQEIIDTAEHPVKAFRSKKDSSMVKAVELVRDQEADAVISAGNSGALLVGGQTCIGRIKGVERPCLSPFIPTSTGPAIIADAGANVDAKANWLCQWAVMSSVYMRLMFDIPNPRVGIINIGAEEEKGNKLVQEVFPMLKEIKSINFIGSVEARDISFGAADVLICDAFVGNVVLKMYEGVAKTLLMEMKNALTSGPTAKIGGMLIKKGLKGALSKYDAANHGGAALLGTKGLVVKSHGNAKAEQIVITLRETAGLIRKDIVSKISESIEKEEIINNSIDTKE